MSRKVGVVLAVMAALTLTISTVGASSVHLKGGKNAEPSFADLGLSLNATSALSGLGNGDILITLVAAANVTSTCTNPAGATQPPGQNPAPITVSGGQAIPASEIKNGTVAFNVTTEAPASPIAGAPDCPNPQWTEAITDLAFTSAKVTIEQPPGTTVLTINCTFGSPTSNGAVPGSNVTCSSS